MVYKRRKFVLWGGIRGGERERATDVDVNSGCCEPSFFFLLIFMLSDVMLISYSIPYLPRMGDTITFSTEHYIIQGAVKSLEHGQL